MRGLGNYKHMPCKRKWIKWSVKIIKLSILSELKSNRVLCFALFCLELDNLIPDLTGKSKGPRITEKQFWKSTRWKNLPYRDLVWKSLVMKIIEFGQKVGSPFTGWVRAGIGFVILLLSSIGVCFSSICSAQPKKNDTLFISVFFLKEHSVQICEIRNRLCFSGKKNQN